MKLILASALVVVSFSILANAFVNYLNTPSSSVQLTRGLASDGTPTVTAPAAGDNIMQDTLVTIQWTGGAPSSTISLVREGRDVLTIAPEVPNTGSYVWLVPSKRQNPFLASPGYQIRVGTVGGRTSDSGLSGIFSIVADPSPTPITVTYPDSSSTLARGSEVTITWTGGSQTALIGWSQNSCYPGDTVGCYLGDIALVPNTGSYVWTVPTNAAVGSGYSIVVHAAGYDILAHSEPFSIQ